MRGLALVLLLAGRAHATLLFADPGDLVDCASYTATTCDSMLWTETDIASSEDSDISLTVQADGHVQNAENGGDATSLYGYELNFATNEARVIEAPKLPNGATLSESTLTVGFRFHLPSVPGNNKTLATFNEGSPSEEGCNVRVLANAGCTAPSTPYACCSNNNAGTCDGKLALHYEWPVGSGSVLGISAAAINPKACWKSDDKASLATCTTAGTDCAPGYTCGNASSACNATTGAGCYWAGLELTQENLTSGASGSGRVRCTLRQNGRKIASGELVPAGKPLPITNVRLGSVVSSSGTFAAHIDAIALDNSPRTRWGWMGWAYPSKDGDTTGNWTKDSCSGSVTHEDCIDDYAGGILTGGTADFLRGPASAQIRTEQYRATAIPTPPAGVSITGVFGWWIGRAPNNNDEQRDLTTRLMVCANDVSAATCGTITYGTALNFTVADDTADKVLATLVAPLQPPSGAWTGGVLSKLGVEIATRDTNTAASRLMASGIGVVFARPDATAAATSREGNKGTDDNLRTDAYVGHSNTGGTVGGKCAGGTQPGAACNQLDYASWDATEGDSPTGGCLGDHVAVRTCTGRRAEWNGSAGYPCGTCGVNGDCENGGTCAKSCAGGTNDGTTCTVDGDCTGGGVCLGVCSTANSECPTSGGTCTGDGNADGVKDGACTQNDGIPCDTNTDCNSLGGACDTTATCVLACGVGGTCAGSGGYSGLAASQIPADTALVCAQGAEGSYSLLTNRWARILDGIEPTCFSAAGRRGACQCTIDANCPGGGTCTSGVCVGGSGCVGYGSGAKECKTCSTDSDCGSPTNPLGTCLTVGSASYCACQFDKPDTLTVHSGAADAVSPGKAPNCAESEVVGLIKLGLCTSAACPVASGSDLCTTDSEAQNASRTPPDGSPSARCLGASMLAGSQTCDGFGDTVCTAAVARCMKTADCPSFNGNAQTCTTNNTDLATIPEGVCQCSADNQCPVGYACSGSYCRRECGRCSTTTTRVCATDGDCPGGETCNASNDASCRASGNTLNTCTTSTPRVCKGRATCPCDRETCSTDADCDTLQVGDLHGRPLTLTGKCRSGRCEECGLLDVGCADTRFPNAKDNWTRNLPHTTGLSDFLGLQAVVDGLTETDARPLVLYTTEPAGRGSGCIQFLDTGYMGPLYTHVMEHTGLRHVIDVREALARHPVENLIGECFLGQLVSPYGVPYGVHYLGPGSGCTPSNVLTGQDVVAASVVDFRNALNHCAVGTCRKATGQTYGAPCGADADCGGGETCEMWHGLTKPRRYCRNADSSFTSTICTTDDECTSPATCELRPCTCVCTQTSECRAWFSDSYSCLDGSNGSCDAGESCSCKATSGFASACALFGGGYSCDTASAKCLSSGVDACPATADGCNPQ